MTNPKQRAKGRAVEIYLDGPIGKYRGFAIFADEYDATMERMARAYQRWFLDPNASGDPTQKMLASIGIAAPKGRARK